MSQSIFFLVFKQLKLFVFPQQSETAKGEEKTSSSSSFMILHLFVWSRRLDCLKSFSNIDDDTEHKFSREKLETRLRSIWEKNDDYRAAASELKKSSEALP